MKRIIVSLGLFSILCSGQLLQTDSTSIEPQVEAPPIVSVTSQFSSDTINLGDSVTLKTELSWSKAKHPILFQPVEGSQFNNLELTSVRVDQKKTYSLRDYKNVTTYTYTLVSQGPGDAGNNAFVFSYDHMGERHEVTVPAQTIKVLPRRDRTVTFVISGIIILLLIITMVVLQVKRKRRLASENRPQNIDFKSEIALLKKRIKKTDSIHVLKEVERLSCLWLKESLNSEGEQTVQELYAQYSKQTTKNESEWQHILKECDHLRFGGGKREEFELMETMHILGACFELKEEDV